MCEDIAGLECSYLTVSTENQGNVSLFTWWLTIGHNPRSSVTNIIQFVILLIITIIAIIANIIVLVVIVSNKKLSRIPTHQYTAAHSINYLWFICVAPMLLASRMAYSWTFSVGVCKVILYTFSVTTFIAIWIFVFISMDRHVHVVQSVKKSKLSKIYPKNPAMATLIMVAFSVVYYIPLLLYFNVFPVVEHSKCANETKCHLGDPDAEIYICSSLWPDPEGALAWNLIMLFIAYLFPLMVICYNYWQIYSNVKKVGKKVRKKKNGRRISKREMEIRVTRTCAMLVVLFVLMWTPIFIVLYFVQYARVQRKESNVVSADTFYWIFCLTLANATVNPMVYAFFNKKFLKAWEDYRLPMMEKCSCWQELVKKSKALKVEPTSQSTSSSKNKTGRKSNKNTSSDPTPLKTVSCIINNATHEQEDGRNINECIQKEVEVIVSAPKEDVES
ncbi:free fatty acid receptor 4-like [Styela clava]